MSDLFRYVADVTNTQRQYRSVLSASDKRCLGAISMLLFVFCFFVGWSGRLVGWLDVLAGWLVAWLVGWMDGCMMVICLLVVCLLPFFLAYMLACSQVGPSLKSGKWKN